MEHRSKGAGRRDDRVRPEGLSAGRQGPVAPGDPWPLGTRGPGLGQWFRGPGSQTRGLRFPRDPGAEARL
ncbi:hypothetical protein GCM10027073_15290 [Streptomyces chlorus]